MRDLSSLLHISKPEAKHYYRKRGVQVVWRTGLTRPAQRFIINKEESTQNKPTENLHTSTLNIFLPPIVYIYSSITLHHERDQKRRYQTGSIRLV
jgi:hypothetical protein